jgi:hypothetical protein
MSDFNDVLSKLHEYRAEIEATLEPAQFAEFEARRAQLGRRSNNVGQDDADTEAALTRDTLALAQQYPAVEAILRDRAPGLLTPPSATLPVIPPRNTQQNAASEISTRTALLPGNPAALNPPTTPTAPTERKWTPELRIQAFKEGVTALIGLLLVALTGYLAVRTLDVAGDQAKSADSQAVLTVMVGLAGVVLGYYFGRVPAEAQATQARIEASAATAGAEAVGLKAEALATEVERTLGSPETTRGTPTAQDLATIDQRRRELREALYALPRR